MARKMKKYGFGYRIKSAIVGFFMFITGKSPKKRRTAKKKDKVKNQQQNKKSKNKKRKNPKEEVRKLKKGRRQSLDEQETFEQEVAKMERLAAAEREEGQQREIGSPRTSVARKASAVRVDLIETLKSGTKDEEKSILAEIETLKEEKEKYKDYSLIVQQFIDKLESSTPSTVISEIEILENAQEILPFYDKIMSNKEISKKKLKHFLFADLENNKQEARYIESDIQILKKKLKVIELESSNAKGEINFVQKQKLGMLQEELYLESVYELERTVVPILFELEQEAKDNEELGIAEDVRKTRECLREVAYTTGQLRAFNDSATRAGYEKTISPLVTRPLFLRAVSSPRATQEITSKFEEHIEGGIIRSNKRAPLFNLHKLIETYLNIPQESSEQSKQSKQKAKEFLLNEIKMLHKKCSEEKQHKNKSTKKECIKKLLKKINSGYADGVKKPMPEKYFLEKLKELKSLLPKVRRRSSIGRNPLILCPHPKFRADPLSQGAPLSPRHHSAPNSLSPRESEGELSSKSLCARAN